MIIFRGKRDPTIKKKSPQRWSEKLRNDIKIKVILTVVNRVEEIWDNACSSYDACQVAKVSQQGLHCIWVTGAHVVASTNLQVKSRIVEVFAITLRVMSRRKERVNFEKETGNDKLSKRIANRHKRDKLFANYFPPVLIEIFFSKILINLNYNLKIWLFYNLIKKLWIYKNIKYFPIYIN